AEKLKAVPGWSVVVSEPATGHRASWLAPLAALAGGSLAALALGLAVAFWFARRVLRPVKALVRRAEAVAAGRERMFLPPVPPAGVAEFEAMRVASEQAEIALAAREAEFRAIFETAAAGVVEIDIRTGRYLRVNQCFCEIAGRQEAELVRQLGPDDVAHPEDRGRSPLATAIERAEMNQVGMEGRLLRPDGTLVWVQSSTAISARDAGDRPARAVMVVQNITARKQAEEARSMLAREVDHRAKNVLAVVQAVLRLTPKDDPRAYAKAVEARVGALARAHTLLADTGWSGADFHALARAELSSFLPGTKPAAEDAARAELNGPSVMLSPAAAQALSTVLHELSSNAVRHGALSTQDGRVELSWSVDEVAGKFNLRWAERGGPPVLEAPSRRGFGSRVVEGSVRDRLGGVVRPSWNPEGLVCELEVPLARLIIPEQALAGS
ncbi:MAG TPA: HWE histidine kinase domain-containing protein, partial [Roseomonas sp.]